MKCGSKVVVRPRPTMDIPVFREIFAREAYSVCLPLAKEPVGLVVDVGSYVGYTCLYWLSNFPAAHVIAFEPRREHVRILRQNIELNGLSHRVSINQAAAGAKDGMAYMSGQSAQSRMCWEQNEHSNERVPVMDIFSQLQGKPIDLMKLDIEGGEFCILEDDRFRTLDLKHVVLEWHQVDDKRNARLWCEESLRDCGFSVVNHQQSDDGTTGLLWGFRKYARRRCPED